MSDWIPVYEQMPDDDTTVVIFCDDEDQPVWVGYHDGDDGWRTADGIPVTVSHWMHLPKPPTGH